MKKRGLDRRISPWRYYFINRRVANLVGFFILMLFTVLMTSAYVHQHLEGTYATTVYAFAAVTASFFYVGRVLGRQKPRNYLAAAGRGR
jgi:uncharacterized membrane protein YesL